MRCTAKLWGVGGGISPDDFDMGNVRSILLNHPLGTYFLVTKRLMIVARTHFFKRYSLLIPIFCLDFGDGCALLSICRNISNHGNPHCKVMNLPAASCGVSQGW